jgi:hypothetical protein
LRRELELKLYRRASNRAYPIQQTRFVVIYQEGPGGERGGGGMMELQRQ